ncbi:MAG: TOBE domain-containing protein [Candidatus Bathyarchaeia archaeon]|jgi:molybdate transport system regulatory protein|nr:TOBE domain-containing protein [Candidatus Bathyarchaeota archaeon A05DMB-4]MDH7595162.1 TOBE domain-containing protein [Candidatus Bathyarchaeota archaeon]
MPANKKPKPTAKIWLETEGQPILGKGGANILQTIKQQKNLKKTAQTLGMSYKYVWTYLKKMEKTLQQPIVNTQKGGKKGGGKTTLTPLGENLLKEFKRAENYVGEILEDEQYWMAIGLKISARNQIRGTVKNVEKGNVTASIKIEIQTPTTITAIISREAVEELNITTGDKVTAVIKATEVMIAKEK